MKKKMLSTIVLALVLALALGSTVAYACIGHDGLYYGISSTYVSATICRCGCVPVENYLATSTRVQYLNGNQYTWTSWNPESGYNVDSMQSFTYHDNVYCGNCLYRWECYTGDSGYQMQTHMYDPKAN